MPEFKIRTPDGRIVTVSGPNRAGALAFLKKNDKISGSFDTSTPIAENPDGVGVTRAFKRGALQTASSLPLALAASDIRPIQDAAGGNAVNPINAIKYDEALRTGLPKQAFASRGVDIEDPGKMDQMMTQYGIPAAQRVNYAQVVDKRIENAKEYAGSTGADQEKALQRVRNNLKSASSFLDAADALKSSPTAEVYAQSLAEAPDTFKGWLSTVTDNPVGFAAFIGETIAESGPQIAAGLATSYITGNPVTGGLVMSGGGVSREYANEVNTFLKKHDFDLSKPETLNKIINTPELFNEAQSRGITRGLVIGAADFAGQLGVMQQIIRKSLTRQAGVQSFSEGGGEALAQKSVGDDLSVKEVATEAVAGTGSVIPEALVAKNPIFVKRYKDGEVEYNTAAADLARLLRQISNEEGLNLADIKTQGGAKQTLEAAHEEISGQIDALVKNEAIKSRISPKNAETLDELLNMYAAATTAIRQGKNKVKSKVSTRNETAILKLIGPNSLEAKQLSRLFAQGNVLTDLFADGTKGGVSQFTDFLNPFQNDGSGGFNVYRGLNVLGGVAGATTFGAAPTAGIIVGGRVIDAVTGRRSKIKHFVKKMENKTGQATPRGPSVIEQAAQQRRFDAAQIISDAEAKQAQKEADNLRESLIAGETNNAGASMSPLGTLVYGTGLDAQDINVVAEELRQKYPPDSPEPVAVAVNEVLNIIDKSTQGQQLQIPALTQTIRLINDHLNSNDTQVTRIALPDDPLARQNAQRANKGPNPAALQQPVVPEAPDIDTQSAPAPLQGGNVATSPENYEAGRQGNQELAAKLQAQVDEDTSLSEAEAKSLNAVLEIVRTETSPLADQEEMYQELIGHFKVPQEAIDKHFLPYLERTRRQAKRRSVLQDPIEDRAEDIPTPYRGSHQPNPEGAPLFDMTGNGNFFPNDIYSQNGLRYYGQQNSTADIESYNVINRVRDNPDAEVTIYRSVPVGVKGFNSGDWVSVSKTYAEDHASSGYGPDGTQSGEVISKTVKAKDVRSPGDDLNEFGFFPAQDPSQDKVAEALAAYEANPNDKRLLDTYLAARRERDANLTLEIPVASRQFGQTTDVALDTGLSNAFIDAQAKTYTKGRDFKLDLQAKSLAAQEREGIDLNTLDDANIDRLADFVVEDGLEALKDNSNAIGWYDRTVTRALETVSELHPEVATDPVAKLQFIWATAVTSNGLKVDQNFDLALDVYEHLKKTGRFPTNAGQGQAAAAINSGLAQYHTMLDKFGGDHAKLEQFMNSKVPVKQIEQEYKVQISGEGKNTLVRGASILGPKIGNGFYSNLYGNFDELTMDRWLMRSVGRWRGGLVKINRPMIAKKTKEIQEMLPDLDLKAMRPLFAGSDVKLSKKMSKKNVERLSDAIAKASMVPSWRTALNEIPSGNDFRKAGNSLSKYLDGQVEAPAGANERTFIRQVFQKALQRLQDAPEVRQQSNAPLTMSDLQALLWYPEKRLYDTAKQKDGESRGYEDNEAPDYANAASKSVRSRLEQRDRLGSLGRAGPTGRGAVNPNAGSPILNASFDNGAPGGALGNPRPNPLSKQVTLPQIKQHVNTAKTALIGKPGSELEQGVQTLEEAVAFAEGLGMTVRLYGSQQALLDAYQDVSPTSNPPKSTKGFFLRTGKKGAQGTVFGMLPDAETIDGSRVSDLESLVSFIHEVSHGITLGPLDGVSRQQNYASFVNPITGQPDVAPPGSFVHSALRPLLEGKGDPDVMSEIDNIQANVEVFTSKDPKERVALRTLKDAMQKQRMWQQVLRNEYNQGILTKDAAAATMADVNTKVDNYTNYVQQARELAVDPMVVYIINPSLAKKIMPKTAALIRNEFQKAQNPSIQFFAHPLAMVVAAVMAMLARGTEEEEEMQMAMSGALSNRPPPPGILSAA